MTGFLPNSAAAPATVGGKLAVIGHWDTPGKAAASERSASQETCRRLLRPSMPGGVPWQLGGRFGSARREALLRTLLKALAPEDATTVSDGMNVPLSARPHLYVCVSCRRRGAEPVAEGEQTDGRRLYEALKSLADGMGQDAPAQVVPTLCFANCERGCSVGLSAAGKWSYLVGEIGPEHAADLLTYATAYAKAKTGVVLPSGRPASLQTSVIARFPAPFEPAKDAAE